MAVNFFFLGAVVGLVQDLFGGLLGLINDVLIIVVLLKKSASWFYMVLRFANCFHLRLKTVT